MELKGMCNPLKCITFAAMTIELNDALLSGEEQTLSMLADEGQLTCITGGTAERRTRWLHVLMGFESPVSGIVSIDGEPLVGGCIAHLRKHIAIRASHGPRHPVATCKQVSRRY